MKIPVSSFLSYLWSYLAYRDVLYIKLKLLRFCFDLMLSFLAPGSIFVEQLRQEVVSFVFRVAQTVFVPNFYIPLIWQLFFFFLWIFSSYAKELMHMISRKKKLCIWYHFIKQNFQIHFVNVFLTHPLWHTAILFLLSNKTKFNTWSLLSQSWCISVLEHNFELFLHTSSSCNQKWCQSVIFISFGTKWPNFSF